ncbi:MAG: helix-turn-helix domain-containing protein [Lachnospiraceae bacterium]
MLHDAVLEFGYDGSDFLWLFIQSGVAQQIENGNPKYIAGKSGIELFSDVIECTTGKQMDVAVIETYERTDVYWVGWVLAQYQWYSGRTFREILEVISYEDLLGLYDMLHEADIQKAYEVLDAHFERLESKLKLIRKRCGITQEQLADLSGVSINTIRAYERKAKDINKAQTDILVRLAGTLECDIVDLF